MTSRIQQELRQQHPFRDKRHEGVVALLRTADRVRRRLHQALAQHGFGLPQFNVLRILRGAGARGLPTMEVSERMVEQAPGITRLVDRLSAQGLVERQSCPEDRRRVYVRPTAAGLALLARLEGPLAAAEEGVLAALDEAELGRFIAYLDAVRIGLGQSAGTGDSVDPSIVSEASGATDGPEESSGAGHHPARVEDPD